MPDSRRPFSVSLGPKHEKLLQKLQKQIRTSTQVEVNRSFAIQIALLAFQNNATIEKLVAENLSNDLRRRRK